MAGEEDDQHAFVKEIEKSLEAETEVAGDEMDSTDDSESSSALDILVNTPESEKSKRKGKEKKEKKRKSKALLSSSPTATVPLSRVSPSPSPAFTSGSKKRGRPKVSKDKKPRRPLAFEEIIGDDFTLHRLIVNPGEDLIKVMEKFNRHYKHRNVCIMSASGTASKVELDGSPYPMQYEGHFQLLSLSVGRIFEVNGGSQNRKEETLLASLSTQNGTVIGGILVGQFIATSFSHIIAGTFKRIDLKIKIPGEPSSANENINLASEDIGVVPKNVSANPNVSSAYEDLVAGTDDQTMQQPETNPNNVDTDEYGDIMN